MATPARAPSLGRTYGVFLALVVSATSCAAPPESQTQDLTGLTVGEDSPEARAILALCNHADLGDLDDDVGLTAKQASGIGRHRRGKDGLDATADDDPFGSLGEIDEVTLVGPTAFKKLLAYARAHDLVLPVTDLRAPTVASVPKGTPGPGQFRVHLIDVGAGLAILIQGHDFNVLFDGGSTDDKRGITATGNKTRLLSYLFAALGPSGASQCKPSGDTWPAGPYGELTIDHVFLSHPHEDHSSMLDEVLRCYRVKHVWDSGAVNSTASHLEFLQAVAKEPGVTYHTASKRPAGGVVKVFGTSVAMPAETPWRQFAAGDAIDFGTDARAKVLHADGTFYPNQFNKNSTVLRLDLGGTSLLLTADAESGVGADPYSPIGDVEAQLLQDFSADLDVDILQVGHHGSSTSTRAAFLRAASPEIALISAGTTIENGGVTFPAQEVVDLLGDYGIMTLRTDEHDDGCPEADHVGMNDTRPGGCDNFVLSIGEGE